MRSIQTLMQAFASRSLFLAGLIGFVVSCGCFYAADGKSHVFLASNPVASLASLSSPAVPEQVASQPSLPLIDQNDAADPDVQATADDHEFDDLIDVSTAAVQPRLSGSFMWQMPKMASLSPTAFVPLLRPPLA